MKHDNICNSRAGGRNLGVSTYKETPHSRKLGVSVDTNGLDWCLCNSQ